MQDRYIFGNDTSLKISNKKDIISLTIVNNKIFNIDKDKLIKELEDLITYIRKYAGSNK